MWLCERSRSTFTVFVFFALCDRSTFDAELIISRCYSSINSTRTRAKPRLVSYVTFIVWPRRLPAPLLHRADDRHARNNVAFDMQTWVSVYVGPIAPRNMKPVQISSNTHTKRLLPTTNTEHLICKSIRTIFVATDNNVLLTAQRFALSCSLIGPFRVVAIVLNGNLMGCVSGPNANWITISWNIRAHTDTPQLELSRRNENVHFYSEKMKKSPQWTNPMQSNAAKSTHILLIQFWPLRFVHRKWLFQFVVALVGALESKVLMLT